MGTMGTIAKCIVCGKAASHNIGGRGSVCAVCCPGCGKTGAERATAERAFELALQERDSKVDDRAYKLED